MPNYLGLITIFAFVGTLSSQQSGLLRSATSSSDSSTSAAGSLAAMVVEQKSTAKPAASGFRWWRLLPRPYVAAGPSLMGGGYAPLAWSGGAGLYVESTHFLFTAGAAYDNGHKTDDADQPNPKGHDRYLSGGADYRLSSGWFFGGGYGWSQLSTSNYTKGGSRPKFGGGIDLIDHGNCAPREACKSAFSMRLSMYYLMKGTDWQNGSQGPQIGVTIPSPSQHGHVFFHEVLGIYRYHTTVTDPSNLELTREQTSQHSWGGNLDFSLMYRF